MSEMVHAELMTRSSRGRAIDLSTIQNLLQETTELIETSKQNRQTARISREHLWQPNDLDS